MTERRAYLFIYNDDVGTREQIRKFLDELPEVLNWRYDIPHVFYIVSCCSAQELAERIRGFSEGRFLIAEVTKNKQGLLPRRTWNLLNKATLPGTDGRSKAARQEPKPRKSSA